MKIPPGFTEREVLAIIQKAVDSLAKTFTFGHYDIDDIKQEGFIFALDALEKEKYDSSRPLENFLYSHIRNRFINLKRNKFRRTDPPCARCHAGESCPSANGGGWCKKYEYWHSRNRTKSNICNPVALENVNDEKEHSTRTESTSEQEVEITEALTMIDAQLPIELRATYLQMRAGVSVPKVKRLIVEEAVKKILTGVIEECPSAED